MRHDNIRRLYESASRGEEDNVRQLIGLVGYEGINKSHEFGWTALHVSVEGRHVRTAKLLLNHGADTHLTARIANGTLVNAYALAKHLFDRTGDQAYLTCLQLICSRELFLAASRQDEAGVTHWLSEQPNTQVNAQHLYLWTALHVAAEKGYFTIAERLLRAGAQKDLRTHDGKTPRDIALQHNHRALAELLTILAPVLSLGIFSVLPQPLTDQEWVDLCLYSFGQRSALPSGWEVTLQSEIAGLPFTLSRNVPKRTVVLAFSGTKAKLSIGTIEQLRADLLLLTGRDIDAILDDFKNTFYDLIREQLIRAQLDDYKLMVTGFSLGGAFAVLFAALHNLEARAFDPLGCAETLERYCQRRNYPKYTSRITCYLAAPHHLNTGQSHVGKLYRLRLTHCYGGLSLFGITLPELVVRIFQSSAGAESFASILAKALFKLNNIIMLPDWVSLQSTGLSSCFCFDFATLGLISIGRNWLEGQHSLENISALISSVTRQFGADRIRQVRSWPSGQHFNGVWLERVRNFIKATRDIDRMDKDELCERAIELIPHYDQAQPARGLTI